MTSVEFALGLAAIVALAAALGWALYQRGEAKATRARRSLLLERAEGKIGAEEFASRQSALDAMLVAGNDVRSTTGIVLGIIAVGVLVAAALSWIGARTTAGQAAPTMPQSAMPTPAAADPQERKQGGDLRELAKPLAQKLAANPDDGPGWLLLARTYLELHQYPEAVAAFENAATRTKPDAQMLVEWTDALVAKNNQIWTATARDLLKRALALDAKNLKALTLAVSEADSRNDTQRAAAYRQQITKLAPSGAAQTPAAPGNMLRTAP